MDDFQQQYIVIELGKERYALAVSEIYEIIKMQRTTEVPNSISFMEGVTNLRGKIVPIISLRKRFDMEEKVNDRSTRIVVVNSREEIIGMIVDRVHQVIRFEEIEDSVDSVSGADSRYFSGMGHSGSDFITILDIENILH
ncbi:chemotaxis protein CheW [Paenibacillus wulumuqiensis]|uniref:chemotaxis protein CheW n=1 Tax=Paenibacillus wulumuqiensis TaxID=1567107 RepID=UPI00069886B6|nr:chemotaxis protein CheW [Paenibacillus wulumuqiensis]